MQKSIYKIIFLIILFYLSSSILKSNDEKGASNFYPLGQNDYWEYLDYEWMGILWDTICVSVGTDTILDGKLYHKIVTHWFVYPGFSISYQRIDSSGDVYLFNETLYADELLYRFSDMQMTYWNRRGWKVRFDSLSSVEVFGQQRLLLPIYYFFDDDSLCENPILIERLCEGIGLISSYVGESNWTEIRGCYISGVRYGSIMPINGNDNISNINFNLEQNYPNPFNPSTTIEFTLPKTEWVTLTVFNILGQQVTTLVSEKLNPGIHKYQWQADNLPSGIYYCRMKAGEYEQLRKMILLK